MIISLFHRYRVLSGQAPVEEVKVLPQVPQVCGLGDHWAPHLHQPPEAHLGTGLVVRLANGRHQRTPSQLLQSRGAAGAAERRERLELDAVSLAERVDALGVLAHPDVPLLLVHRDWHSGYLQHILQVLLAVVRDADRARLPRLVQGLKSSPRGLPAGLGAVLRRVIEAAREVGQEQVDGVDPELAEIVGVVGLRLLLLLLLLLLRLLRLRLLL